MEKRMSFRKIDGVENPVATGWVNPDSATGPGVTK